MDCGLRQQHQQHSPKTNPDFIFTPVTFIGDFLPIRQTWKMICSETLSFIHRKGVSRKWAGEKKVGC
jgi:hypothetical protein